MNIHSCDLKLNLHNNRGEKAGVRNGSLKVGLGFTCNTDLGVYFVTLDSFATVEGRKIIFLKYVGYRKYMEFKNSPSVAMPGH